MTLRPPVIDPEGRQLQGHGRPQGRQPDIGDQINKQMIQPLIDANTAWPALTSRTSTTRTSSAKVQGKWWNASPTSLPSSRNRTLDFSKNRADDDDILGDAYQALDAPLCYSRVARIRASSTRRPKCLLYHGKGHRRGQR